MQKGFTQVYLLIGLVVLALLGGAYYFDKLPVKSSIPQPQVSVSPSPKPTQIDETINWKKFTNTKYNYELKYPNDWQLVSTDESSIGLYPPTSNINSLPQPGILVGMSSKPFVKPLVQLPALTAISPISVDGIDGYKFNAQGAPFSTLNTVLPYQGGTLRIAAALDKTVDLNLYSKILSTFKFTN